MKDYHENKEKYTKYQKTNYKNNKINWVKARLKKYGLTIEDYNKMIVNQDNKCFICKNPPSKDRILCIDHCHKTKEVRKLLCEKCNFALGLINEDVDILENMKQYLQLFNKNT